MRLLLLAMLGCAQTAQYPQHILDALHALRESRGGPCAPDQEIIQPTTRRTVFMLKNVKPYRRGEFVTAEHGIAMKLIQSGAAGRVCW